MSNTWRYKDFIRIPMTAAAFMTVGYFFSNSYDNCTLSDQLFDNLLTWAGVGSAIAISSYFYMDGKKINYFSTLILRSVLIFTLFYSVYYQFWYDPIPNINLIALNDTTLKEIKPYELNQIINKLSPSLQTFQGLIGVFALFMLLNRKTATLGFLLMIPSYAYAIASNLDATCDMNITKILLFVSIFGTLPDMFNIIKFWAGSSPIKRTTHPLFKPSHLYNIGIFLKFFILIGLLVLFYNKPNKYKQYYANNTESPIKGVWTIKEVSFNKNTEKDYQSDSLLQAKKIYLSSSRFGKIRMNDTLSTFEYMVDPTNNQFELWNFLDYRKLDLKGKFEYLSEDTVRFNGKNEKDEVTFTMVLEDDILVE